MYVTKFIVFFKAKKITLEVTMKLIKVTRKQAVEKKIMTLQVCAVEVNLLGGVQLEALVALAVGVPAVAAVAHAVLRAIVHQAHQEVAVRVAAVVVEAVVTVIAGPIVTPTQRKRMRKKSLVVRVRTMTKGRINNSPGLTHCVSFSNKIYNTFFKPEFYSVAFDNTRKWFCN